MAEAAQKSTRQKTRVLLVSKIIDCGVRIVAAGHGVLRQQPSCGVHTLHGEHLAHQRALVRSRAADMSLRKLHVRHFITMERIGK